MGLLQILLPPGWRDVDSSGW